MILISFRANKKRQELLMVGIFVYKLTKYHSPQRFFSGHSSRYVKRPSEENPCHEIFNGQSPSLFSFFRELIQFIGAASASLKRSFEKGEFPIERKVFEEEYQMLSRDMQLYVKHLLEDYAQRDATPKAGQADG